jgi:hypothetical protein
MKSWIALIFSFEMVCQDDLYPLKDKLLHVEIGLLHFYSFGDQVVNCNEAIFDGIEWVAVFEFDGGLKESANKMKKLFFNRLRVYANEVYYLPKI